MSRCHRALNSSWDQRAIRSRQGWPCCLASWPPRSSLSKARDPDSREPTLKTHGPPLSSGCGCSSSGKGSRDGGVQPDVPPRLVSTPPTAAALLSSLLTPWGQRGLHPRHPRKTSCCSSLSFPTRALRDLFKNCPNFGVENEVRRPKGELLVGDN